SQAQCSILLKPVIKTQIWVDGYKLIENLANCMEKYAKHLKNTKIETMNNQSKLHPVRQIANDATIEHRQSVYGTTPKLFQTLEKEILKAGIGNPVMYNEWHV
ncbi:unnamed protein product, partial [Owenia fusiformis]